MIPTKTEIQSYAIASFRRMEAFVKTRFNIDQDRAFLLSLNFREGARCYGRAGIAPNRYGVTCGSMKLYLFDLMSFEVKGFNEYARLAKFSSIGTFFTNDWKLWLDTLIAHEMAHVVQFLLPHTNNHPLRVAEFDRKGMYRELGQWENGHGDFFRRIYQILRNEFVNHRIDRSLRRTWTGDFARPEGYVRPTKRKTTDNHPLVGKRGYLAGHGMYEVIEINLRAKKYPVIMKQVDGAHRFKMSVSQAQRYIDQAANSARAVARAA